MNHFVYLIRPVRPDFLQSATAEEEVTMDRHFQYLKGLAAEGRLMLAGPCLDAAFGIVILVTESEDEARTMMENDPAVLGGVMVSELHPFKVSILET